MLPAEQRVRLKGRKHYDVLRDAFKLKHPRLCEDVDGDLFLSVLYPRMNVRYHIFKKNKIYGGVVPYLTKVYDVIHKVNIKKQ